MATTIDLSGKRVGVTGAGGFIGTALCARLVAEGAEVAGIEFDRARADAVTAAGAEFREADVTDAPALAEALGDADLVVHTAAIIDERAPMEAAIEVNVRGTRNAIAAATRASRFVHLSSVAAFAFEARYELPEEAFPRRVGGSYFDTKATSEELARRGGATVVRPGDVYGPGSVPWARRPLELAQAGKLVLPAGGKGLMTLVYVDDLVDATVRALVVPEADGGAFNAWDGHAVTTAEFFGHFARMAGGKVRTAPDPVLKAAAVVMGAVARVRGVAPDMTGESLAYISRSHTYSTERARSVLGWEPQVDLDEGMRRTEAWFRTEGLLA